jgi:hypothetical protein
MYMLTCKLDYFLTADADRFGAIQIDRKILREFFRRYQRRPTVNRQ